MKTFLKATFLMGPLIALSFNAQAQSCRELKNSIKTHCQVIDSTCESIKSCLTRRDTCVGKVPKNIPRSANSCVALNECMTAIKGELPSGEQCRYHWSQSEGREGICTVDRHWLYSEDGCPGKIGGLLNNLAYGLSSEVDTGFTCEPTRNKYVKQRKSCTDAIKEFESSCTVDQGGRIVMADEDKAFIKEFSPKNCEYSDRFSRYRQGDFELAAPARVDSGSSYDGSRSGKRKIAPHSDDRAPGEGDKVIRN